jgi:hypothetical protein
MADDSPLRATSGFSGKLLLTDVGELAFIIHEPRMADNTLSVLFIVFMNNAG